MAGLKQGAADSPKGADAAGAPLAHGDVRDVEDTTITGPGPNLAGKRLQAVPQEGGTRVTVKSSFFSQQGVSQSDVIFDFFRDRYTVEVGDGKALSNDAANALMKVFPDRFKFVDGK